MFVPRRNRCATILNPPSAYSTGLKNPYPFKSHRKLIKDMIPTSTGIQIAYPHADDSLLPTACMKEANCTIRSPGNTWCTSNTPPQPSWTPFIKNAPGKLWSVQSCPNRC